MAHITENEIKNLIEQKNHTILLEKLIDITNEDQNIEFVVDQYILHLLENTIDKEQIFLYEHLPDVFTIMHEPRLTLPVLITNFKNNVGLQFYSAQAIFYLIVYYDTEYETFYEEFYKTITMENICKYRLHYLSFVKIILNEYNVTFNCVKSYIKRLCRVSIDIESELCVEILNLVLVLMKLCPMCFEMCNELGFKEYCMDDISYTEFQPYLYELDLLSVGVKPVRKMVNIIRNESYKKKEKYDRNVLMEQDLGFTF